MIKDYDYRPWLSAYIAKYQDDPQRVHMMFGDNPLETDIRKLMAGKISAVVDSQTAVLYTARTLSLSAELRLAGWRKSWSDTGSKTGNKVGSAWGT